MLRPSTGPPVFLIPADSTDLTSNLQGDRRHFITAREFAVWSKSHPSVRPAPPASGGSTTVSGDATPTAAPSVASTSGYRAPQHPTSHILRSIPPRAPSRSTRSNILSYTLHLSTTSLISSYQESTSPLLRFAECTSSAAESCTLGDKHDLAELLSTSREAHGKVEGYRRLAASLLREARKHDDLPPTVQRRVELATLSEGLLAQSLLADPEVEELAASTPVVPFKADDAISLKTLLPLTAPVSTATGSAASQSKTRIAQSLLDMKFGTSGDQDDVPMTPAGWSIAESAAASTSSSSGPSVPLSANKLTALPHMDYRIVRGEAMRTRAKLIYSQSLLASTPVAQRWCRRHRVATCVVCASSLSTPSQRATGTGSGLLSSSSSSQSSLASLIPTFLLLSSSLLTDLRDRAAASDTLLEELEFAIVFQEKDADKIDVTAGWYALLHELVIQSVLHGYLVEGWEGTGGLEILFGVGCGVWEGRSWGVPLPSSSNVVKDEGGKRASPEPDQVMSQVGDSSESESGDDEDEEEEDVEAERERERSEQEKRDTLIKAAQKLFGSRDIAQADFERSMKDRAHEFLDVPESSTLVQHLTGLSAKYPLSTFEDSMIEFIEATSRLLGLPAIAKLEASAASSTNRAAEADAYALARFFARPETDAPLSVGSPESLAGIREGKRRRVE